MLPIIFIHFVRVLAEKIGFDAQGLGAPVTFYMLPNYYIREYFSVIKYFLLDSHT